MSCHFTHLLVRRMLRASETDRSGLAQAGLSVRTSPFSLWSGEKPEHQLPDASAGTELALDVSCTLFHLYSPNFLLQGLKKKNPFSFPKLPRQGRRGRALEAPSRGSVGRVGCGQGPVSMFRLPCRKRLRRCIVCIRTPLSPPTPWWPCRS